MHRAASSMEAPPAASKLSGDQEDVPPSSAVKSKGGGRCTFVQIFVALSFVVVLCVLLYAPRFSLPSPHGVAAAFFSSGSSRVGVGLGPGGFAGTIDEDDGDGGGGPVVLDNQVGSPCASMPNNSICCDRSDYHSDVCFMAGDVRTDAATLSLLLFPPPSDGGAAVEERIRPYTRKWDKYITRTIHEVKLRVAARPEDDAAGSAHRCDARHDAPAFVVTSGGYSHNFFHAFNDGVLPAWLTAQHLRRRVVLAVLDYNPSWAGRFSEVVSALSRYHVVDLLRDKRTHCFPGAIVGTRYHDYLAVDPARLRDNKTVVDFHDFLAGAYDDETSRNDRRSSKPKPSSSSSSAAEQQHQQPQRLRLGIVSRKGRRVIENQAAVVRLAESIGFDVDVMDTGGGLPQQLSAVYERVSAYDALVGVHGADLTSFLFLRPGSAALVQIAPLGISLLSRNLFGVPAARMGLHYEQYDVLADESSLSRKYPPDHVVVADPARARREQGKKEWDLVEFVYLRGQNVSLDLGRFRETLTRIHSSLLLHRRSASSLPAASNASSVIP